MEGGASMSNRDLPMMPWFPKEFMAATATWSFAERSAYRALLDVQWEMGVLPNEPWRLAQAIGLPLPEFEPLWEMVRTKFEAVRGGIRNERLEEHRVVAFQKKRGQKAGADATNAKRRANRDAKRFTNRDDERDAMHHGERDGKRVARGTPPSPSPSPSEEDPPLPPKSAGRNPAEDPPEDPPDNPQGGTTPPRAREEAGTFTPEDAWRDVTECDVKAYSDWLTYRAEEADSVPARVRIVDAKFLAGKGGAEVQRAFVAELIRLRFRRLHDPFHGRNGGGASPAVSQDMRVAAEADEIERLKAKRADMGIPEFRDPYQHESPASYETAMRMAARDVPRRGLSPQAVSELVAAKKVTA
jgi:uncharacterized protein YdaU (DUF1376 family)